MTQSSEVAALGWGTLDRDAPPANPTSQPIPRLSNPTSRGRDVGHHASFSASCFEGTREMRFRGWDLQGIEPSHGAGRYPCHRFQGRGNQLPPTPKRKYCPKLVLYRSPQLQRACSYGFRGHPPAQSQCLVNQLPSAETKTLSLPPSVGIPPFASPSIG
jgi:hypothetical protein